MRRKAVMWVFCVFPVDENDPFVSEFFWSYDRDAARMENMKRKREGRSVSPVKKVVLPEQRLAMLKIFGF